MEEDMEGPPAPAERVSKFTRIAAVWTGILDTEVTAQQVALCLAGMRLQQAAETPDYPEYYEAAKSFTDIASSISVRPDFVRLPDCDHGRPAGTFCTDCHRARQRRDC